MAHIQKELEKESEITTVAKTPSSPRFEIVDTTIRGDPLGAFQRINDILDLISDIEHELPPMRISFSHHDNPNMLSDWRIKPWHWRLRELGRQENFPPIYKTGWIEACHLTSLARQNPPLLPPPSLHTELSFAQLLNTSSPKSFISTHRATMDPCMHLVLLVTHGQFLSHDKGPYPHSSLMPQFSLCKTLLHHDVRPPVPYGWVSDLDSEAKWDLPWEKKVDERLNCRGSTTGLFASPGKAWRHAHRSRLVSLTNAIEGNLTILSDCGFENYSRIAPWVHYVPIQISYADLYDALAFFRTHGDLAESIATQGKEWSRNFWKKEDMAAYLYR
ncbi:glycosyltransferase family 90 protein, partial [Scleroderma citrinum Foug A]